MSCDTVSRVVVPSCYRCRRVHARLHNGITATRHGDAATCTYGKSACITHPRSEEATAKTAGKGSTEKKQTVLACMLLDPKGWKETLMSVAVGVEFSKFQKTTMARKSRGELEQIHGYQEATRKINSGKFEKVSQLV